MLTKYNSPIPMIRKLITTILLAVLTSSLAIAQSNSSNRKISARFLHLNKHTETPSSMLLMTKLGPKEIRISSRSPRDYVQLPKDGKIILGLPNPEEEKEILPLATGKVAAGISKALILLSPSANGKYSLVILDESKFKGGSVCFINQCGQSVGVTLNNKKFLIKNNSTFIHTPFTSENAKNTHVSFHVGDKTKNIQMKLLAETIWNISPTRGEICVFYRDKLRNRAAFKVFASHFPSS